MLVKKNPILRLAHYIAPHYQHLYGEGGGKHYILWASVGVKKSRPSLRKSYFVQGTSSLGSKGQVQMNPRGFAIAFGGQRAANN